jgi:hypothetical protein
MSSKSYKPPKKWYNMSRLRNLVPEKSMGNYDYNKKFEEISNLSNRYEATANGESRKKLDKQIKEGFKELEQKVSRTDDKEIAKLQKLEAKFEKQSGAILKHDPKLHAIQDVIFGSGASAIDQDEVQRKMNFAADELALEKQYKANAPTIKASPKPNSIPERPWHQSVDIDLSAHHPIGYITPAENEELKQKLKQMEEDSEISSNAPPLHDTEIFMQKLIDLSEKKVTACEKKLPEIQAAIEANIIPQKTAFPVSIASVYPQIDNKAQVTQPIEKPAYPQIDNTVVPNQITPSLAHIEQQGIELTKKTNQCLDKVSHAKEKLGPPAKIRSDSKVQKIAAEINKLFKDLIDVKKSIETFCLNPIKAFKSFFGLEKESSVPKLLEATAKMEKATEALITIPPTSSIALSETLVKSVSTEPTAARVGGVVIKTATDNSMKMNRDLKQELQDAKIVFEKTSKKQESKWNYYKNKINMLEKQINYKEKSIIMQKEHKEYTDNAKSLTQCFKKETQKIMNHLQQNKSNRPSLK